MAKDEFQTLKEQIDVCSWQMLAPHVLKSNAFVVDPDLDFLTVADHIRRDEALQVKAWVEEGRLSRPTTGSLAAWGEVPDKTFRMVVVAPFLLIQEVFQG